MEAGAIVQSGKYEALLEEGQGFKQLVDAHKDSMGGVQQEEEPQQQHLHHHQQVPLLTEELAGEPELSKSGSRGELMLRNLSRVRSRQGSERYTNLQASSNT